MTKIAFAFTICTATERGKFAAKQITLGATIDYDRVKWWQFEPVVETSLEVMADRLRTLALQPKRMIVMGAPLAGLDLSGRHRGVGPTRRRRRSPAPIGRGCRLISTM